MNKKVVYVLLIIILAMGLSPLYAQRTMKGIIPQGKPCTRACGAFRSKLRGMNPCFSSHARPCRASTARHSLSSSIKIASGVPENTAWGQAFNRMAAEWTQVTNREVIFQIFHNGVAGAELDVLRKLRLNEIQGAVFSTVGLSAIAQEIMTLSVPFLIRTDNELDAVHTNAKDDLERIMSSKGFQVLAWANAGWVRFFSKNPVLTPSDLTRIKLGTIQGQAELTQAFRAMGRTFAGASGNCDMA